MSSGRNNLVFKNGSFINTTFLEYHSYYYGNQSPFASKIYMGLDEEDYKLPFDPPPYEFSDDECVAARDELDSVMEERK